MYHFIIFMHSYLLHRRRDCKATEPSELDSLSVSSGTVSGTKEVHVIMYYGILYYLESLLVLKKCFKTNFKAGRQIL